MFPQVAPKFFGTRAQGPKNLGKAPEKAAQAAPPAATPQKPANEMPGAMNYVITLAGKTHAVVVAPAGK
jgi:methylmalonyl-CoA carboxyltransferase 5S subunit